MPANVNDDPPLLARQDDVGPRLAVAGMRIMVHAPLPLTTFSLDTTHGNHSMNKRNGALGHRDVMHLARARLTSRVIERAAANQEERTEEQ